MDRCCEICGGSMLANVIVASMSTTVFNVSGINSTVKSICYADFLYKLYNECTDNTDNIENINKYIETVRLYEKDD